jgi:cytidylate kinase
MPIVTIRGQLGSGAPEIGKLIAEKLHADYVDREIIAEVAARLQRQEEEVIEKEMPPSSFLGRVAEALGHSGVGFEGAYLPLWQMPLDDIGYLETLESVVKKLAQNQPLVIQGRGSQFILKGYPGAFHVFIVAPIELRVKRVMESLKVTQEAAKREITRFDNSRREFIRRYFHVEREEPEHYDLVINTEHFSFEAGASILIDALSLKD